MLDAYIHNPRRRPQLYSQPLLKELHFSLCTPAKVRRTCDLHNDFWNIGKEKCECHCETPRHTPQITQYIFASYSTPNPLALSVWVLYYFQLTFVENCINIKNKKKSIKDQRDFCSNTYFKVFANSVSAHFKIWCSRFSNKQNDIIFLAIFLKLKNVIFDNYNAQFIPNINFDFSRNHQSVNLW